MTWKETSFPSVAVALVSSLTAGVRGIKDNKLIKKEA
jgi:hypothetical protein